MGRLLKDYGLAVVLFGLFAASLALQYWTGWEVEAHTARSHGESPDVETYLWNEANKVFENWQSEFLQVLAMVVLTAYLIYKGSVESKDGDEELKAMVQELLDRDRA